MVAFSHTDTGTSESEWAASGVAALPELPLSTDELAGMTFVVLAAHPDDETLGAGGFLAKLHAAGAAVEVLLCTAGEASHPDSQTTTPEQLAAVRLTEFDTAVSGLAPSATCTPAIAWAAFQKRGNADGLTCRWNCTLVQAASGAIVSAYTDSRSTPSMARCRSSPRAAKICSLSSA